MRSLRELLTVVRDNRQLFATGLCSLVTQLYHTNQITLPERRALNKFIDSNPPRNLWSSDLGYYWKPFLWSPRLRWLNEQINKLNKDV